MVGHHGSMSSQEPSPLAPSQGPFPLAASPVAPSQGPFEAATVVSLGRSCKAKAKAKAKYLLLIAEYAEQALACDAAEERRAERLEAEFSTAGHNAAASEPSPWKDMESAVSILVPSSVAGTGIPCTECHTEHRGGCSFHDLLLTDIATLKLYAETLVPPGPEFHSLRGALYTLMGTIHGNLARGGVTPEKFRELRAGVLSVKEQCNLYVP